MIPDFQVNLGGTDRTERIRPLLSTISVIDNPGIDADSCDITLKAEQMLAIPERGTDVVVKLGFREKGLSEVFSGVANKVGFSGPPDRLFIQATGIALSDDKRLQGTHVRSWNDATLGDVLTEIIQDAGFKARVHDDLSGIEINRVIQSIETDIEILSQLSQMYGGVIKSDGETVAVVPRDSLETASGQKLATVKIHLTECSKYSWTFRHRRSYKTVVAFYQDGEEMQTRAYVAGSGEPERRLKRLYANRDTARVAAERELRRVKRLTTLQLTVPGRFVTAGSPLVLAGSPTRLEGLYQVLRVRHSFGSGYVTEIEAEGE